nr:stabilin-1-like [Pocillopora verrucosa]
MKNSIPIYVLLLWCFLISVSVSSQGFCEADQCRVFEFTPEKAFDGKRLINHVIRIVEVLTMNFCDNICYIEPGCVSINVYKQVSGHGGYKCELNNVTHERHEHDLEKKDDYFYHAAESACVDNPCDNNSTCQSGFTDKGYRCLCTTGFKGPRCEKDINECADGTSKCSADAMCNNTEGSYRCKCKPGFTGNGRTCKDIDECATGKTNCSADAVCNNIKRSYNCTCKQGYYGDGNICRLAPTCKEIFDRNVLKKSGEVTLHLDSKPTSVFCHMGDFGCGDGGWTPIMKINGSKRTFNYDFHFWKDKETYEEAAGKNGFDLQETKLPTYWKTSFSKICLGMQIGQQLRFIFINKTAESLYSLIADGKNRATSLGRDAWKKVVGSQASLQQNCNMEGFNVKEGNSKARIGIIANQENDCFTCDSRIGFGTEGDNSCGNVATHKPDNGNKHIRAMGYILVH